MAIVETHAPGTFCWFELGTTDPAAAKQFYANLFNWSANDADMGPGGIYTTFTLEGHGTGACYALSAEMKAQGVPPHWMIYVAAADADATAAKVAPAGGKVVMGAFDVMDFGRMAVLQDPAGAAISIWQPKTHQGVTIAEVPGTACWADCSTPDQAGAVKFYQAVFAWKCEAGKDNDGYLHISAGDKMIGGIPPPQHRNPNTPPHWMLYFLVENCDASTEKANQAGATVHMPPTTMEGVGRWSVIADPQGAVLSLFQMLG